MKFVRPASHADVEAIGRVQSAAWLQDYVDILPASVLPTLQPEAVADSWRHAMRDALTILVAVDSECVCGFVAFQVAGTHAEVLALVVDPRERGGGHGSRLINAFADTARAASVQSATMWCPAADTALGAFLAAAGWQRDGGERTLERDGTTVTEVRYATELESASPPRPPQA